MGKIVVGVDGSAGSRSALRWAFAEAPIPVSTLVAEGNAARALLDASEGADLLVVGSRGHGGFTGVLVGSVSQQCVNHAKCPVVVVHPN